MDGHESTPPAAPLPVSFRLLRLVASDELSSRLEPVKTLREQPDQLYRIVKDTETGEHYLHYAVVHLNLAGGGAEEEYHHLLPLAHDDVIAFALGSPFFEYPGEWKQAYLRNGPDDGFVWYDPDGAGDGAEDFEEAASFLRAKLLAFKQSGNRSEEDIAKLLEELDRGLPRRAEESEQ